MPPALGVLPKMPLVLSPVSPRGAGAVAKSDNDVRVVVRRVTTSRYAEYKA